LLSRAVIYAPLAAAAASGGLARRPLSTRTGDIIGSIDCIDSGDNSAFYIVLRFERDVAWDRAKLLVLPRDAEEPLSIELTAKTGYELTHQVVLDRAGHARVYDALRDPSAEAFVVRDETW
jgi:hypothetical protein